MSKYVKTREQRNGWMRLQKNELKTGVDTNMAKKLFLMITLLLLPLVSCEAAYHPYPEYLNNNHNFPIVYAHMGVAYYLDVSSIVVKQRTEDGSLLVAANEITYDNEKQQVVWGQEPQTVWYYYTSNPNDVGYRFYKDYDRKVALPVYQGRNIVFDSWNHGFTWHAFDLNNPNDLSYNIYSTTRIDWDNKSDSF